MRTLEKMGLRSVFASDWAGMEKALAEAGADRYSAVFLERSIFETAVTSRGASQYLFYTDTTAKKSAQKPDAPALAVSRRNRSSAPRCAVHWRMYSA